MKYGAATLAEATAAPRFKKRRRENFFEEAIGKSPLLESA
jgi:hypothetical protein